MGVTPSLGATCVTTGELFASGFSLDGVASLDGIALDLDGVTPRPGRFGFTDDRGGLGL